MFEPPVDGWGQATTLKVAVAPRLRAALPGLIWRDEMCYDMRGLLGVGCILEVSTHPQVLHSQLVENGQESVDFYFERAVERAVESLRRQVVYNHTCDYDDSQRSHRLRRMLAYRHDGSGWTAVLEVIAADVPPNNGWIVYLELGGGPLRFLDVEEEVN